MRVALLITATLLTSSATVHADFDISDFSTTTVGLTYPPSPSGPANTAAVAGTALQVTPGVLSNLGVVWTTDAQPLAAGFSTTFTFEFLTPASGAGGGAGDGLAFVIQNDSLAAIGNHASAIGYGGFDNSPERGINSSLAVEIDDFSNGNVGDPNGNHVSIHTRFADDNTQDEPLGSIGLFTPAPFGQGTGVHTMKVEYAAGSLSVFLDNLVTPILVVTVDLTAVLGSSNGWIGFTGSGGGSYQIENVYSWSFASSGGGGGVFRRGDCNGDAGFNIADEIFLLASLFSGGPAGGCTDACDQNDDGGVNIADAIFGLESLFAGGPPPMAPGSMTCGPDPTSDNLDCVAACP